MPSVVSHYKHSPFFKVEQPLNKGMLWDIFEYLCLCNFSKLMLRVSFSSYCGSQSWERDRTGSRPVEPQVFSGSPGVGEHGQADKHGHPSAWVKEQQSRGHGWREGVFPSQLPIRQFIKLNQIASSTALGEQWLFERGHASKRDLGTTELGIF